LHRLGGLAASLLGGLLIFTGGLHVDSALAGQVPAVSAVPEAPAPGYTPRFVTQTDERPPWEDCLWASGAMLLDKWTHGRIQPDRERLRAASRDFRGGSTFADLARAASRRYGWRPRWSPDGGDPLTWRGLLDRLAKGGGAVIAGDYGDLGNPFIRWSRSYAADPHAAGHAMYVERYDAAHDRIWLMDPLGRGGYSGEWAPARRIYAFIWKRRGHVFAMATPTPPARSATGYVPGPLALAAGSHRSGETVAVALPFTAKGPWPLPELQLDAKWEPIAADGLATPTPEPAQPDPGAQPMTPSALVVSTADPALFDDRQSAGTVTVPASLMLSGEIVLPGEPGLWRMTAAIERRDGRALPKSWQQPPLELRVWGDRGAVVTPVAPAGASITAGDPVEMTLMIENAGRLPWSAALVGPQLGEAALDAATELDVAWVRSDGVTLAALPPMTLTAPSAAQQTLNLGLFAPKFPGSYELRVDVRDGQGSLLAPEAAIIDLPLLVDPAPMPTLLPVVNQ
jgi:hypothetical protein